MQSHVSCGRVHVQPGPSNIKSNGRPSSERPTLSSFKLFILTPESSGLIRLKICLFISNRLVSCQLGFLGVSYLFQLPREALKEERILKYLFVCFFLLGIDTDELDSNADEFEDESVEFFIKEETTEVEE